MLDIFRRTLNETRYRASRFFEMVKDQGGLAAALQLIHARDASDGYTELHLRKRLDLTMEAVVLDRQWDDLFSEEDRRAARKRLSDYKYLFPPGAWSPPV